MTLLAGIEEAGRGPVIGPLCMAIVAIDEGEEFELKSLGVKDSKELSPHQRERMFDLIQDMCEYEVLKVEPEEIDRAVNSDETNLNWLEAEKMAELINRVKPDKVIVDAPSNNIESYEEYMTKFLKEVPDEVVVKHHADRDHTIVGAASILAKITRDRAIEEIQEKYGVSFGSGYPSDSRTREFIKENWDKYPIFRKSWSTWKNAAEQNMQKGLRDY